MTHEEIAILIIQSVKNRLLGTYHVTAIEYYTTYSRSEAVKIKQLIRKLDTRCDAYIDPTSMKVSKMITEFKEQGSEIIACKPKEKEIDVDAYAVHAHLRYNLQDTLEETKILWK